MRISVLVLGGFLIGLLLYAPFAAGPVRAGEAEKAAKKIIVIHRYHDRRHYVRRRHQRYLGFKRLYRGQRYLGFKKTYSGPKYLVGSY
jgi:hypothetical protein